MQAVAYMDDLAHRYGLVLQRGTSPDNLPEVSLYSHDMKYRYAFARWWGEGPVVLWVGLNPGTGDTERLTQPLRRRPTLGRCIAWSRDEWKAAGLIFLNLFAYRSAKPSALRGVPEAVAVGPHNDAVLDALRQVPERTVVAWGAQGRLYQRAEKVAHLFTRTTICLGVTVKSRQPRHPLYVPGDAPVLPWPVS